jgi:hypothetical protein
MGMTAGGAAKAAAATKPATAKPAAPPPAAAPSPSPAPKPPAPSKFSVIDYISRTDSSDAPKPDTTDPTKLSVPAKKRKRVSWAREDELEKVKMIENITIQYGDDLFWHPPGQFGNARDLDRSEGHAFETGGMEYDVEEEIEWYEPKGNFPDKRPRPGADEPASGLGGAVWTRLTIDLDFSSVAEAAEDRGIKRAGKKVPEATEAEAQKKREAGVLLVTYLNDGDIPDSPSEPFLGELVTSQQIVQPKVIPLPQELRVPP